MSSKNQDENPCESGILMRELISGAGPAGLSLANALCIEQGVQCKVFEQVPHFYKSACFMLQPNGSLAARAIGLLDALEPFLNEVRYQQILAPDGSLLVAAGDLYADDAAHYGVSFGLMTRHGFVSVAHAVLPSDVVQFNSQVVQTEQLSEGGVRVQLADEAPTIPN